MCEASQRLTRVSKDAHDRGVRVGLAYFVVLPEDAYIGPLSPLADTFPRTLEELGVPIIHPGLCMNNPCNSDLWGEEFEVINTTSWFPNCQEGQALDTCNDQTIYNIDFWLLDGRTIQLINDDAFFKSALPDKSLLAGQYTHIPMNDGTMSYEGVARFLNDIADNLEKAQTFYSTDKQCQNADVTSNDHIKLSNDGGKITIDPGHVACYNRANLQEKYMECPSLGSGSSTYTYMSVFTASFLALVLSAFYY